MATPEDTTRTTRPVGFSRNFHSEDSFERSYQSVAEGSNRLTVGIPKETSYSEEVLRKINRVASENQDRSFRVLVKENFGKVGGNRWKSELTIDGETYSSRAGGYSYNHLRSSLENTKDIKGAQFVLNDKTFSKSVAEQMEGIPKAFVSLLSSENPWGLSLLGEKITDSVSSELRSKDSDIIINKFQFSDGRNPNVEVKKWQEYLGSEEFDISLYKGREAIDSSDRDSKNSALRLMHSKFFTGKKEGKDWSYVYTAPETSTSTPLGVVGAQSILFDLSYSTEHPKVRNELSEYYKTLKETSNNRTFSTYEGDVVLGGGNLILKRFIEDVQKAEGDIRVASASFEYNEIESDYKSEADKKAKTLLDSLVSTLAKKEQSGSDVSLLTGRIGPREKEADKQYKAEKAVKFLRQAGVDVDYPNYQRTDRKPHFNLFMAENINKEGTDVFYLTTRRLVGESHEEIALRITSDMDEESYKRFRDLFDLLKSQGTTESNKVQKELSNLSGLENVEVEEVSDSDFLSQEVTSEEVEKNTKPYKPKVSAHPSVHRVMTNRLMPKYSESSIDTGYEIARPLTNLPQSFYDLYRDAPRLPEVNLYENPNINEDLNQISLKERINRWAKHDFSKWVDDNIPTLISKDEGGRDPLIKKDETFLTGVLASLGHRIDAFTGHYEFQRHKLDVEGFYEGSPRHMEEGYNNPPDLPEGPFENLFKGISSSISGITTAFVSYGLFRGTSLLGAYMEDEMSRMIGEASQSGSRNAVSNVVKSVYMGGKFPLGKSESGMGRLSLGRSQVASRKIQAATMDYAMGGVLETIAFDDKKDDMRYRVQEVRNKIGAAPHIQNTVGGGKKLANVGRERIRELASEWDKIAGSVPANMIYWIPGLRKADDIQSHTHASMSDLIGRSLEDLLMTFERTTSRFGNFITRPGQTMGKVRDVYRASDRLSQTRRSILNQAIDYEISQGVGETSIQEMGVDERRAYQFSRRIDRTNRSINNYFYGDQPPGSEATNVRVEASSHKTLFGLPLNKVRGGLKGATLLFGADYLVSNVLSGSGGLTFLDYLGYRSQSALSFLPGVEGDDEITEARDVPKDLPFWATASAGTVGGLAAGWAFPDITHDQFGLDTKYLEEGDRSYRDPNFRERVQDPKYILRRRKADFNQANVSSKVTKAASYDADPKRWQNFVDSTPRARFNTTAAMLGFAFLSSGARIGSYLLGSGTEMFFDDKSDSFDNNELAYIASQRIDSDRDPDTLSGQASQAMAEDIQRYFLQKKDSPFESKFSTAFQFSIPLFQFTAVQDTIPGKDKRIYSFGFQTFPMLGSGITPTFPVGVGLFARPESERQDIDSAGAWLGSVSYRLATLPSELFTALEQESDYESLFKTVGTVGLLGDLTDRVIPKQSGVRSGLLGNTVRTASRLTMDLGSSVLSAPVLIGDSMKNAFEDAYPKGSPLENLVSEPSNRLGSAGRKREPKMKKTSVGTIGNFHTSFGRSILPYALSYFASTILIDRDSHITNDEFMGEDRIEEDKSSRLWAIGELSLIYGTALQGGTRSYNLFARPEVTYNYDRIRVDEGRRSQTPSNNPLTDSPNQTRNHGYNQMMAGVDSDYTNMSRPKGTTYTSRHIGRFKNMSLRVMATYYAGQALGTIGRSISEKGVNSILDHDAASGFRIWLGEGKEPTGYDSVRNPQQAERVVSSARETAIAAKGPIEGSVMRAESFLGGVIDNLDIFNLFGDAGGYVDVPNIFVNLLDTGQTFRQTTGDYSSDPYVQFQGIMLDLSASYQGYTSSDLTRSDKEMIRRLVAGDNRERLNSDEVMGRILTVSPRQDSMQYSSMRSSEVSQASSPSLSKALAVRSFYTEHLANRRPQQLLFETIYYGRRMGAEGAYRRGEEPEERLFSRFLPELLWTSLSFDGKSYSPDEKGVEQAMSEFFRSQGSATYTAMKGMGEALSQWTATSGYPGTRDRALGGVSGEGSAPMSPDFIGMGVSTGLLVSGIFSAFMTGSMVASSAISAYETATQQDFQRRVDSLAYNFEIANIGQIEQTTVKSRPVEAGQAEIRDVQINRRGKLINIPGLSGLEATQDEASKALRQFDEAYRSNFIPQAVNEIQFHQTLNRRQGSQPTLRERFRKVYSPIKGMDLRSQLTGDIKSFAESYRSELRSVFKDHLSRNISYTDYGGYQRQISLYNALTGGDYNDSVIDDIFDNQFKTKIESTIQAAARGDISEEEALRMVKREASQWMAGESDSKRSLFQFLPSDNVPPRRTNLDDLKLDQEIVEEFVRLRTAANQPQTPTQVSEVGLKDTPKVVGQLGNKLGAVMTVNDVYGVIEGASLAAHHQGRDQEVESRVARKHFWKESGMLATELSLLTMFTKSGMGAFSAVGLTILGISGLQTLRSNNEGLKEAESNVTNFLTEKLGFIPRGLGIALNTVAEAPSVLPGIDNDFNLFQDVIGPKIKKAQRNLAQTNGITRFFSQLFIPRSVSLYNSMIEPGKKTAFGYQPFFYGSQSTYQKQQYEQRRRKTARYGRSIDIIHHGLYGQPSTYVGRARKERIFSGDRVVNNFSFNANYHISNTIQLALERRQRMADLSAYGYTYRLNETEDTTMSQVGTIAMAKAQAIATRSREGIFFSAIAKRFFSAIRVMDDKMTPQVVKGVRQARRNWMQSRTTFVNSPASPNIDLKNFFEETKGRRQVLRDLGFLTSEKAVTFGDDIFPRTLGEIGQLGKIWAGFKTKKVTSKSTSAIGNAIKGLIPDWAKNLFGDASDLDELATRQQRSLYELRKADIIRNLEKERIGRSLLQAISSQDLRGNLRVLEQEGFQGTRFSKNWVRGLTGRTSFGIRVAGETVSKGVKGAASWTARNLGSLSAWGLSWSGHILGRGAAIGGVIGAGLIGSSLTRTIGGFAGGIGLLHDADNALEAGLGLGSMAIGVSGLFGMGSGLGISTLETTTRAVSRLTGITDLADYISRKNIEVRASNSQAIERLQNIRSIRRNRLYNSLGSSSNRRLARYRARARRFNRSKVKPFFSNLDVGNKVGLPNVGDRAGKLAQGIAHRTPKGEDFMARMAFKGGLNNAINKVNPQGVGRVGSGMLKGFAQASPDIFSGLLDAYLINKAHNRVENLDYQLHYQGEYEQAYGDLYGTTGGSVAGAIGSLAMLIPGVGPVAGMAITLGSALFGGWAGSEYGEQRGREVYRQKGDGGNDWEGWISQGISLGANTLTSVLLGKKLNEFRNRKSSSPPPPPPPTTTQSREGNPPPPPPTTTQSREGNPPPPPPTTTQSREGNPPPPPPTTTQSGSSQRGSQLKSSSGSHRDRLPRLNQVSPSDIGISKMSSSYLIFTRQFDPFYLGGIKAVSNRIAQGIESPTSDPNQGQASSHTSVQQNPPTEEASNRIGSSSTTNQTGATPSPRGGDGQITSNIGQQTAPTNQDLSGSPRPSPSPQPSPSPSPSNQPRGFVNFFEAFAETYNLYYRAGSSFNAIRKTLKTGGIVPIQGFKGKGKSFLSNVVSQVDESQGYSQLNQHLNQDAPIVTLGFSSDPDSTTPDYLSNKFNKSSPSQKLYSSRFGLNDEAITANQFNQLVEELKNQGFKGTLNFSRDTKHIGNVNVFGTNIQDVELAEGIIGNQLGNQVTFSTRTIEDGLSPVYINDNLIGKRETTDGGIVGQALSKGESALARIQEFFHNSLYQSDYDWMNQSSTGGQGSTGGTGSGSGGGSGAQSSSDNGITSQPPQTRETPSPQRTPEPYVSSTQGGKTSGVGNDSRITVTEWVDGLDYKWENGTLTSEGTNAPTTGYDPEVYSEVKSKANKLTSVMNFDQGIDDISIFGRQYVDDEGISRGYLAVGTSFKDDRTRNTTVYRYFSAEGDHALESIFQHLYQEGSLKFGDPVNNKGNTFEINSSSIETTDTGSSVHRVYGYSPLEAIQMAKGRADSIGNFGFTYNVTDISGSIPKENILGDNTTRFVPDLYRRRSKPKRLTANPLPIPQSWDEIGSEDPILNKLFRGIRKGVSQGIDFAKRRFSNSVEADTSRETTQQRRVRSKLRGDYRGSIKRSYQGRAETLSQRKSRVQSKLKSHHQPYNVDDLGRRTPSQSQGMPSGWSRASKVLDTVGIVGDVVDIGIGLYGLHKAYRGFEENNRRKAKMGGAIAGGAVGGLAGGALAGAIALGVMTGPIGWGALAIGFGAGLIGGAAGAHQGSKIGAELTTRLYDNNQRITDVKSKNPNFYESQVDKASKEDESGGIAASIYSKGKGIVKSAREGISNYFSSFNLGLDTDFEDKEVKLGGVPEDETQPYQVEQFREFLQEVNESRQAIWDFSRNLKEATGSLFSDDSIKTKGAKNDGSETWLEQARDMIKSVGRAVGSAAEAIGKGIESLAVSAWEAVRSRTKQAKEAITRDSQTGGSQKARYTVTAKRPPESKLDRPSQNQGWYQSQLDQSGVNARVSDGYGVRPVHPVTGERNVPHPAVDIVGSSSNARVENPFTRGRVISTGRRGGYGNTVVVQQVGEDGELLDRRVRASHLSSIGVEEGDTISGSTVLGRQGSTGRSSGRHVDVGEKVRRDDSWETVAPGAGILVGLFSDQKVASQRKLDSSASIVDHRFQEGENYHPNVIAMMELTMMVEGTYKEGIRGYQTFYGGGSHPNLQGDPSTWTHPDEAITSGGYNSSASGAFQIMQKHINRFSLDEPGGMDPRSQREFFVAKLKERGLYEDVVEGNIEAVLRDPQLSTEWAGFPNDRYDQPDGLSVREGIRRFRMLQERWKDEVDQNKDTSSLNAQEVASKYDLSFVSIYNKKGDKISSHNADETPDHAASLIKMVAADVTLEAVSEGNLSLDQSIQVDESLYSRDPGYDSLTVKQALRKSLVESDNTAFNLLVKALGGTGENSQLNQYLDEMGYDDTQITSYLANGNANNPNELSPNDASKAMVRLINRSGEGSKLVNKYLKQATNQDPLPGSEDVKAKWGRTSQVASHTFVLDNGIVATVGVDTNTHNESKRAFKNQIYNAVRGLNKLNYEFDKSNNLEVNNRSDNKTKNASRERRFIEELVANRMTTDDLNFVEDINIPDVAKGNEEEEEKVAKVLETWEQEAEAILEIQNNQPKITKVIQPNYDQVEDTLTDTVASQQGQKSKPPRRTSEVEVDEEEGEIRVGLEEDEEAVDLALGEKSDYDFLFSGSDIESVSGLS